MVAAVTVRSVVVILRMLTAIMKVPTNAAAYNIAILPHVMIVGAKGLLDAYPRNAKPDTAVPYVMWPDTPYEHLMIPVR
jgi:hypothetical protein